MQSTTHPSVAELPAMHPIVLPMPGWTAPVYRSVTTCPACHGDGIIEVELPTYDPTALEPRSGMATCDLCSNSDSVKGRGWLPVLRCVHCNLPMRPEDVGNIPASHPIESDDPDLDLNWCYREAFTEENYRLEYCECGPDDLEYTIEKIARVATLAGQLAELRQAAREFDLRAPNALHGIPLGIVLHLAQEHRVWNAHPAYVVGEYGTGCGKIELYSDRNVPPDHVAWAYTAGIAQPNGFPRAA